MVSELAFAPIATYKCAYNIYIYICDYIKILRETERETGRFLSCMIMKERKGDQWEGESKVKMKDIKE